MAETTCRNVSQARKFFHDWLDRKRPWANCNDNVYPMMEQIVAAAEMYFTDNPPAPSREYVAKLETAIMELTMPLGTHPSEIVGEIGAVDVLSCCHCSECVDAAR